MTPDTKALIEEWNRAGLAIPPTGPDLNDLLPRPVAELPLFAPAPAARRTDPATSRADAESMQVQAGMQRTQIMHALQSLGPMTIDCPKDDPSCEGTDAMCHDACERSA